ncbi:MAG: hypothetical protein U0531_18855 [Dehalococcoidia bacterium]
MLLVTGATGYLGAAFAAEMVSAGLPAGSGPPAPAVNHTSGVRRARDADLDDEDAAGRRNAGLRWCSPAASVGHSPAETRAANVGGTRRALRRRPRRGWAGGVHRAAAPPLTAPAR